MKNIILSALMLLSIKAFCQAPPQEFFAGLNLVAADVDKAKTQFLIAEQKEPSFYGTYHFLGEIYLIGHKPDSAIWSFKKSLELNTMNTNHTKEMVYVWLINTYVYQHDFKNAFDVALEACKLYPDNTAIPAALKDLCLWAYYTKHNDLDITYLSFDPKPEYVVNDISEEYMIVRKLKFKLENYQVVSQALANKNGASYDVLKCISNPGKNEISVDFKINWDMGKFFGGKHGDTKQVAADAKLPIYERLGAMVVDDAKLDIKAQITSLMQ